MHLYRIISYIFFIKNLFQLTSLINKVVPFLFYFSLNIFDEEWGGCQAIKQTVEHSE
jgi:hypothetical protein